MKINQIKKFSNKARPQNDDKKREKEIILENLYNLFDGRKKVLNGFESKIFLIKSEGSGISNTDRSKLNILTPKQMLQRLPIEDLLNETRQIVYSLYQSKDITKKICNNIIKSI